MTDDISKGKYNTNPKILSAKKANNKNMATGNNKIIMVLINFGTSN